jgi:hypothetical protein
VKRVPKMPKIKITVHGAGCTEKVQGTRREVKNKLDALDQLIELAGMPCVIAAPRYPSGSRRARDRFSRILSLSFFLA